MSKRMPKVGGTYLQAESEIAAINMVLGASAAGVRAMTSSSSPGISLKGEGISYMAGSDLPAVIINVQRGGPGLGGPGGILVAVGVGAPHAHKGAALFCLAGVVYNIGNFNFLITLCNAQRGQQTRQFHKKHFLSRGKAWACPCKSTDLSYSFTKFLSIKMGVSAVL